ncbi:Polycomb group RING finger protein 3 [Varanus komodoensis]|nr:Polycomb group RING finger protein 3 [Varanus komodoensis]
MVVSSSAASSSPGMVQQWLRERCQLSPGPNCDAKVSICLECNSSKLRGLKRKWIRCSAQATVLHLKKFIAKKLNLSSFNELDILCNEEILGKDHTLKFVVVTRWRFKKAPLLLHYRPKMDLL